MTTLAKLVAALGLDDAKRNAKTAQDALTTAQVELAAAVGRREFGRAELPLYPEAPQGWPRCTASLTPNQRCPFAAMIGASTCRVHVGRRA